MYFMQITLFSEIFGVDVEDPYQDSGSEYLPTRSPSPSEDLLDILLGAENQSPNSIHPTASPQNDEEQVQKPRKRVRQPSKWKKNIRKVKRAKGEQNGKRNFLIGFTPWRVLICSHLTYFH